MKDCFGKTVTSLEKARECRVCKDFDLCSRTLWQDQGEEVSEKEEAVLLSSSLRPSPDAELIRK